MRRVFSILLSAVLLLNGCASTRVNLVDAARAELLRSRAKEAYMRYQQKARTPSHPSEQLNLALLAYEAGDQSEAARLLNIVEISAQKRDTVLLQRAARSPIAGAVAQARRTSYLRLLIHYYSGLCALGADDTLAARNHAREVLRHMDQMAADSVPVNNAFWRFWADALLDTGVCSDSGRVVVLCESGFVPTLTEYSQYRTVYSTDPSHFYSDSAREAFALDLAKRNAYEATPSGITGHPRFDLFVTAARFDQAAGGTAVRRITLGNSGGECLGPTEDVSFAVAQDLAGVEPTLLAARLSAEIVRTGLQPGGAGEGEYMASTELYSSEPWYEPSSDKGKSDVQQPQQKREGKRSHEKPADPPKDKKDAERKDTKKQKPEEKKEDSGSQTQSNDADSDDGGSVIGAIVGVVAFGIFLVVGYGIYLGVKALVKPHRHASARPDVTMPPDFPAWEVLPDRIYAVSAMMPAGSRTLQLAGQDGNGVPLFRHDFPNVTVRSGRTTVLRFRYTE